MIPLSFTYDNRTGRRPVRAMRAVLPGAAQVWDRVEPYADAWRAHDVETLGQPGPRWIVPGDSLSQGVGASATTNLPNPNSAATRADEVIERAAATGTEPDIVTGGAAPPWPAPSSDRWNEGPA